MFLRFKKIQNYHNHKKTRLYTFYISESSMGTEIKRSLCFLAFTWTIPKKRLRIAALNGWFDSWTGCTQKHILTLLLIFSYYFLCCFYGPRVAILSKGARKLFRLLLCAQALSSVLYIFTHESFLAILTVYLLIFLWDQNWIFSTLDLSQAWDFAELLIEMVCCNLHTGYVTSNWHFYIRTLVCKG